ncbi:hypothetical protein AM232_03915 [Bacillus sp. FJAT-21352]|nr:hypothetical protein AM232_03915 [Bacillus sp. FJAT-21352]
MKDKLVLNRVGYKTNLQFFLLKIPVDFRNPLPFRRLSASLLDASLCGVSASQFFGRSVAYFFHPLRSTRKNMKDKLVLNRVGYKTSQHFFKITQS